MYLNDNDIKALKIILENNSKVRPTSRRARAIKHLNHTLIKNQAKIKQQQKMIHNMFDGIKKRSPWD